VKAPLKPQTTIQILRCFTLGGYTARVVDGRLETEGPQRLAGPLPASIKARRGELIDFLGRHSGGVWPPKPGSDLREIERLLGCDLSSALDIVDPAPLRENMARSKGRIHIPTARRAGLVTYDYSEWPPGIVYIGRRFTRGGYNLPDTPWKNENKFRGDDEREGAVALYREDVLRSEELLSMLGEIEDKILACWCKPDELCHGDVLLELLRVRYRKPA
jgi:hypothetical protein